MCNTLSDNKLYGHEKASPGIVSGSPIGGLHFAQPAQCHPKMLNICYHVALR